MNTLIFFLARVFPGGRASGSVCLANWPISWGENTLIPSLRVDPKKNVFTFKNSDRDWWPSPGPDWLLFWGECMVSPSEEEVYDGGTLTFSVDAPKGSGSGLRLGGSDGQKNSETAHWWGMCWDTWAQRQNRSASPLRDATASWSLREIFFKWVPHHGKRLQGRSVFTSGVPNMSGTRLTWKKFDWSRHVFQLGPPSLLFGLMAQASLEEFQLSTPSPHDIVDVCRLHGWGPWGALHQVKLKSGWAVM